MFFAKFNSFVGGNVLKGIFFVCRQVYRIMLGWENVINLKWIVETIEITKKIWLPLAYFKNSWNKKILLKTVFTETFLVIQISG